MKIIPKRNLVQTIPNVSNFFQFLRYILTRLYKYPKNVIPKYLTLDVYFILVDLLRKNHFYGFYSCQLTAIIK